MHRLMVGSGQTVDVGKWEWASGIVLPPTNPEVSLLEHLLMNSSLKAPRLHISNPWHSPSWRLTGFSGCSEWVFYFSSSTVETKVTPKWNFQKIATYLLSLWGGEFHSVWIIGALTCQCNSDSALLMIKYIHGDFISYRKVLQCPVRPFCLAGSSFL